MLQFLAKFMGKREAPRPAERSGKWPAFERAFLAAHPTCAACGATGSAAGIQGHHILPFHLFPKLELEESNIIAMCRPNGGNDGCHYFVGHLKSWESWNSAVRKDAATWLAKIHNRPAPIDHLDA